MKISGFTIVRNAGKYYFPVRESIVSALPLVDEFIVALGTGDEDDDTLEQIRSIASDKIRIIHRQWDESLYVDGAIFKAETDAALEACRGDWCLYLQADEVLHEEDLPNIRAACERHLTDTRVDGLLFDYLHFWGDYQHYLPFHGWYPKEIRVVRNQPDIRSYKDAQSFRKSNNEKLSVVKANARIYHYGYVRPPHVMNRKKKEQDGMHIGIASARDRYGDAPLPFDFGDMRKIPVFEGTHPAAMQQRMKELDWQDQLAVRPESPKADRARFKHEKWRYRALSRLERMIGREIFSFKNYNLLK